MHELSVALALLRLAREEMRARGGRELEGVRVVVGELAGVEPELLIRAWELAAGPGVELVVDRERAAVDCPDCGPIAEPTVGTWLVPCPRCGAPLRVRGGDALDVVEITYAGEATLQESPPWS